MKFPPVSNRPPRHPGLAAKAVQANLKVLSMLAISSVLIAGMTGMAAADLSFLAIASVLGFLLISQEGG
ncbi:MAG: hypothetical protein H0T56_11645 [Pseudaminobacter sp.]|nr:hypothetical protein [Pseudaminobacter sp.]